MHPVMCLPATLFVSLAIAKCLMRFSGVIRIRLNSVPPVVTRAKGRRNNGNGVRGWSMEAGKCQFGRSSDG